MVVRGMFSVVARFQKGDIKRANRGPDELVMLLRGGSSVGGVGAGTEIASP